MNRNLYLNAVATLALAALVFFGVAAVTSIDSLRGSVDRLRSNVEALESKLNAQRLSAPAPSAQEAAVKEASPKAKASEAANAEFYDPAAVSGDRLIAPLMADTRNLNSLINNDATLGAINSDITESLAERNYKEIDKFQPLLAESWSVSADKLAFSIKLRKGVLWHDFKDPVSGKEWKDVEVKAQDFKFFVDVVKNEDVDCAPMRVYFNDLKSVELVSDYEFNVVWSKPYFKAEEMTLGLQPLPRHLYHAYDGPFDGKRFNDDSERNRILVGTGPYRFDSWDKGQRVVLRKWEKYYGRELGIMPPIDVKAFDIIKHPITQLQALTSKSLDEMTLPPDLWVNRANTPDFGPAGFIEKIKYPGTSYNYLGYNLRKPLFQDRRLRQAFSCLIDREKIVKNVYFDLAQAISGPFFPGSAAYDKSIAPYPFSVAKAKALLKEAGWADSDGDGILDKDGRKLEMTVIYPNANPNYPKMLPIIKEDMAKAGVQLNLMGLEWSVVVERLEKKDFEVCALGWLMGLSPSDPYQLFHSSQADVEASSNHIGFKNAEADRLIEEIRVCMEEAKRIELYHQFHRLLYEEAPYTFLFSPMNLLAVNKRYRNLQVFPGGVPERILWTPKAGQLAVPGL